MATRLNLQTELENILGSQNVYFQPPESIKLKYPCIVYSRSGIDKHNAGNKLYKSMNQYEVTVIDRDPDSTFPTDILAHFPMCGFSREFVSDNLYHNVLTIYY